MERLVIKLSEQGAKLDGDPLDVAEGARVSEKPRYRVSWGLGGEFPAEVTSG